MADQPIGPTGQQEDGAVALWLPTDQSVFQPRKLIAALPPNPTMYYAVAFWTQDGFSVKQGVTVNTLVAGP